MRRKALGRDLGLMVRMAVALALVAVAYAGAFFALGVHIRGPVADRNWVYVSWVAVALVGLAALLIVQLRKAPQLALKAANAHVLSPDARPKLQQLVARVAAQADLPTPLVAVVHSHTRNSFVVGRTARSAVLALTTGLLGELDERELEAVIAHELAHVANGDAVVMTIVSAPVTLGTTLWERREGWGEGLVWVFGVLVPGLAVLYAVGLVLQRAMSRYREYAADRGSALVTGAPEQLMSALTALSGGRARGDLRLAMSAFCILPTYEPVVGILRDHPTVDERVAALSRLARTLGEAMPPASSR